MKHVTCQNPQYRLYDFITNCIGELKLINILYTSCLIVDVNWRGSHYSEKKERGVMYS